MKSLFVFLKNEKKNLFVLCGIILSVGLVLTGIQVYYDRHPVSKLEYYDEKNGTETEIRLLTNWNYTTKKGRTYQKLISEFNAVHSDIKVKNDYVWDEEYYDRLNADFASENEPDIFISWPGEDINRFAENGKIVNLTPLFTENDEFYDNFDKSLLKYIVANEGCMYGIPTERVFSAVYVNKDVLESAGLKPASDFDELKAQIPILKSMGKVTLATDLKKNGILLYKNIAAALGGKFYTDSLSNNGTVNEKYTEAMNYFKELYELGAFPQNVINLTDKDAYELFLSKKAAYMVEYSYCTGELMSDTSYDMKNLQLISFPSVKGGKALERQALYGVGGDTMFISSKSFNDPEKRDKILEFIKFMISDETAEVLREELNAMTAFGEVREGNYGDINMEFLYSRNEIIDFPDYYAKSEIWTEIENSLPDILNNRADIETVLQNMLD